MIAGIYLPRRHSPSIGPTSHPVPSNSWRQLPAFISAPSSEQKPTFGPDHLDSFLPLQLRSRRRRPCHTFVSRLTKILVPDLPSRYVRQDRCPSAKAGKCSAGQFLEGTVASCPITTPKSSVRVRTSRAAAPYRLCTNASLPSEDSCSPLPPERISKQQLIACTCRGAAFGRTPPTDFSNTWGMDPFTLAPPGTPQRGIDSEK